MNITNKCTEREQKLSYRVGTNKKSTETSCTMVPTLVSVLIMNQNSGFIKNKTKNNKHVICQLYNMKLQKEVKSNPKQPSCKKSGWPQECCCEKRCEIQSGSQEMATMVG